MRTRPIQVNTRLTLEEKQRLDAAAARTGLTASGYLRMLLNGWLPKQTPPPEYDRLLQALYALQSRIDPNDPQTRQAYIDTLLAVRQAVTVPERRA